MSLMRGMRKNIKGIYWVVAVMVIISFVLWGTRMAPQRGLKYAGKVFGKKVSVKDFRRQYRVAHQLALQMEAQGRSVTAEDVDNIAWQRVVELREAESLGITVPRARVEEQIRLMFSPEGTFDESLYREFLYRRDLREEDYVASLRDEIKVGQLERLVLNSVVVSPWETQERFDYENEERKIGYHMVEFAPLLPAFEVTDFGEAYYRSHRGEFRESRNVAVQYVMVETSPLVESLSLTEEEVAAYYEKNKETYKAADGSTAPLEEVKPQIEHLLKDQKADQLAREKAEALLAVSDPARMKPVAEENGLLFRETGLIPEEGDVSEEIAREAEFRKAVFNTPLGEVSPLIKTSGGYCVLSPVRLVPERIPSFEEVREKAAAKQREQQLKEAAIRAGLSPEDVDPFVREHSATPPEIDVTEADARRYYDGHKTEFLEPKRAKVQYLVVEKASFESEVRLTEREIKSEYDKNNWKYKDKDGKLKPLEEVRDEIEKVLKEQKVDNKAKERADEVFVVSRPQRLKEYGEKDGLVLRESRLFAQGEMIDDYVGDSPVFARSAFQTGLGEISPMVRIEKGYCILSPIQVVEERVADFEEVAEEAAEKAKVSKAEMLAGQIARELRTKVNEKMTSAKLDFETACKELGLTIAESGYFKRDDQTVEGVGSVPGLAAVAFRSEPGTVIFPRRSDRGYFLFAVTEIKKPTEEEFAKEKDTYYDQLRREKGREAFGEWIAALMQEANVSRNYARPALEKPSESASPKGAQSSPSPGARPGGAPSPGRLQP